MKNLFTGLSTERDSTGNLVVELCEPIGLQVIGLATSPFVTSAGYILVGAPLGFSWQVIGVLFLFIAVTVMGIALMFWQRARTRVRVSLNRGKTAVFIDSHSGRRELPIRDIEKAELGTSLSTGKHATTIYRLVFVLRNQERVPATTGYFAVNPADREKLLETLNHELLARSGMLS
ncbi:MAG: hypothetical protein EPO31_13880 [Gammaproteobacteria bacterium]|nr:MAG: hypothetical protein EPO31_13880 [Gammaproteobacteria bacterium]